MLQFKHSEIAERMREHLLSAHFAPCVGRNLPARFSPIGPAKKYRELGIEPKGEGKGREPESTAVFMVNFQFCLTLCCLRSFLHLL